MRPPTYLVRVTNNEDQRNYGDYPFGTNIPLSGFISAVMPADRKKVRNLEVKRRIHVNVSFTRQERPISFEVYRAA